MLSQRVTRSVAARTLQPFFEDCMIQSEENGGQDVLRFDPTLVTTSKNKGFITEEMILQQSKSQRFALLLQCVESKHLQKIYEILTKNSELTPTQKWNRIRDALKDVKLCTHSVRARARSMS